jgi:hypothetical protein
MQTNVIHSADWAELQWGRGLPATECIWLFALLVAPASFNEAVAYQPRKAMNFFAGDPDFMWLQWGRDFSATEWYSAWSPYLGERRTSMRPWLPSHGMSRQCSRSRASPSYFNEAVTSQPRNVVGLVRLQLEHVASMRPWPHNHGRQTVCHLSARAFPRFNVAVALQPRRG